jgi:putative holliday junction resolvase
MHLLYYNLLMRLIGIDYGEKRVGIASTDESGEFAIPRIVLTNDVNLFPEIEKIAERDGVKKIVLGESKKLDGSDNLITKEIKKFKKNLEDRGFEVIMHPEMFTSMEAERIQGKGEMLDASAASLILKSYIDKEKNDIDRTI